MSTNIGTDNVSGKVTAVVGPSGSGKSTIASLILRMYDVSRGHIYIDGVPVAEFNPQWLRQHIGLVAQVSKCFFLPRITE